MTGGDSVDFACSKYIFAYSKCIFEISKEKGEKLTMRTLTSEKAQEIKAGAGH